MQNTTSEFRYLEGRQENGTLGNWHMGRGEGVYELMAGLQTAPWWSQAPRG